jgi:hypothetical protein
MFLLSPLIQFCSCKHCNLFCFLWCTFFMKPTLHVLWFIITYSLRLIFWYSLWCFCNTFCYTVITWIFQTAQLFELLTQYCSQISNCVTSWDWISTYKTFVFLTYCQQSVSKFAVISITISSPERWATKYTWIQSSAYQDVISLIVSLPDRRVPSLFMNALMWENYALWQLIFLLWQSWLLWTSFHLELRHAHLE